MQVTANTGRNIQTLGLEVAAKKEPGMGACHIFVNWVGTLRCQDSIQPGFQKHSPVSITSANSVDCIRRIAGQAGTEELRRREGRDPIRNYPRTRLV